MRRISLAVLALGLFGVQPLLAATYYVGTCHTGPHVYSTIQAAVSSVPAGSTVDVCPGTYNEQVIISEGLTLEQVPNSNGSVVISDAGITLAPATSIGWGTVTPQVWIAAGPVNVINISVSQTTTPSSTEVGVFYGSGSSGTVKGVDLFGNVNYVAIVAENGAGATESVTIENNYFSGQISGVSIDSNQVPPSLTADVRDNDFVIVGGGTALLSFDDAQGSMSNNFIAFTSPGEGMGVWAGSANVAISGNWIWSGGFIGIDVEGTAVNVTSNQIFGAGIGINLGVGGVIVKSNGITASAGSAAIDLNCTTGNTVTGNIINSANVGLDQVPAGFTGSNTFYNVATRTTDGCS